MSWTNLKKSVLLFFTLFLLITIGIAQSANPVTITVSSTEYDNPSLTGLKEYLKTNSKVKGLKSTFSNSVAILSFTYSEAADELWDELPVDKKQAFKLTSIDSKTIRLQVVKSSPVSTANGKADSKNCGCDYFPLCKFDKTRSFMGEVWKGLDNNGKITYYHCSNGILKAKYELYDNFEGNSLGFVTYTALKQNEPKGGSWKETVDINGAKYFYEHIIIQKNIRIKVDDKEYSDVIKVRRIVNAASLFYQGQPQNLMQIEYGHTYYVKGVGAFTEKNVLEIENLKSEVTSKNPVENDNSKHRLFWELTNYKWGSYIFLADGSVRKFSSVYQSNGSQKESLVSKENWKGKWKVSGNSDPVVEIIWEDNYMSSGIWQKGTTQLFYFENGGGNNSYLRVDGGYLTKSKITDEIRKSLATE